MSSRHIRPAELVRRTQQSLTALYEAGAPEDGLTLPQFTVLDALKRHGPQTGQALIKLTGIDRSTLFSMRTRLAGDELIATVKVATGEPGPVPMALSLTHKGVRALKKAETAVWNAEVKLMARLTPQEKAVLLNALALTAFAGPRPS